MDQQLGGQSSTERSRQTAANIARNKVLAAYSSDAKKSARDLGRVATSLSKEETAGTYKQTPINTAASQQKDATDEWKKYHSAWQNYYQKYYSEYYAKAAKSYLENEKLKAERGAQGQTAIQSPQAAVDPTEEEEQGIMDALRATVRKHAKKEAGKKRRLRKFIPIFAGLTAILVVLFLQYNRLIFAPIMAYVSPGDSSDDGITAIDPTVSTSIGGDNRLIIPKLNVDVPVHFGISNDTATINAAMEEGVAQFSIPGASAMPGEIGNLVISGHSAGDIYSNNQYKFIFSGLERLTNGDLIYINHDGVRYTYSVTGMETVEPSDVAALVYETDHPVLTLITCTPLGTSRFRLLVSADQVSPTPSGAAQTEYAGEMKEDQGDSAMPENEPTFFERIWNFLTGQN